MANYTIEHEPGTRILVCRITGFLSDAEGEQFARDMLQATRTARRGAANLLTLFDNRLGNVFSTTALQSLNDALKRERADGDRAAVLVANTINKAQARRNMSDGDQLFVSEEEARAWLTA
jgi:MFS superfamily sulfate permease-like transporter